MENKELTLNKEYRLDDKSKQNSCCPKCGRYQQAAVCRYVEGRGPVQVITCYDCNVRWIKETFSENADLTYTFVEENADGSDYYHVIPQPF